MRFCPDFTLPRCGSLRHNLRRGCGTAQMKGFSDKNGTANRRSRAPVVEKAVHGVFLILGLITVGFVLLITVYLIAAGIPAIREIGISEFLFGR